MTRKRKAENKFKVLLEKAIMQYADKASIAYPSGAKDIRFLSPPITKILFFLVYNHKILDFLAEKYENKKMLRLKQKEMMEELNSSTLSLDSNLKFKTRESFEESLIKDNTIAKKGSMGEVKERIGNH